MTIFGVDIHPTFQKGINIEQIAREGFDFLSVKASQGTNTQWADGAKSWLDRGAAAGMVVYPYHYLSTDDAMAQARAALAATRGRGVCMLDFEQGSGNAAMLHAFLGAAQSIGLRVPLQYVPRWYWQSIGSPSLAGLTTVSSRYLTATGYASQIYAKVPSNFWDGYGGVNPTVLQFSDRATVAGQKIDVNAYQGTKDQFAALIGAATSPPPIQPPAALHPQLNFGDNNAWVFLVQIFLNKTFPAYSKIDAGPGPTSQYGPQTQRVVAEFQKRCNITGSDADGSTIGPKTWTALLQNGFR